MNVYVGMGVHHKRSQITIVDGAGVQQRNRNLANDPAKLIPVLGVLAPGTPVAFEAASGWGWLVELLAVAHQGWMVGATNWPWTGGVYRRQSHPEPAAVRGSGAAPPIRQPRLRQAGRPHRQCRRFTGRTVPRGLASAERNPAAVGLDWFRRAYPRRLLPGKLLVGWMS
jgi:hypothetical protein